MDDLSGLDWSSRPGANPSKPPVMNNSAFASLRPTPSPVGGSGRSTPASLQGAGMAPPPKPAPAKPAQDSFSNLMNFNSAKSTQNLTMAERQAQLEAEKRRKLEEQRKQTEAAYGNGQFWDSLGSRGATTSPSIRAPPPATSGIANDDDDLFAAFNKDTQVDKSSYYPPPDPHRSTPPNNQPLNLQDPATWNSARAPTGMTNMYNGLGNDDDEDDDDDDDDDDDPFGLGGLKPSKSAAPAPAAHDNDDFMGDLGRPVHEIQQRRNMSRPEPGKPIEYDESSSSSSFSEPERIEPERVPKVNKDPFDKAVAQLVDYGFSAEDATRGLVESGSGYNAQAAVNWLLDEAHRKSKEQAQGKSGSKPASPAPRPPPRTESQSPARAENDLAKSAAAVGNSLFKTANSLWKTGQKKMQQAVADFQQPQEGGDPSQPKWMRDAQMNQGNGRQMGNASATDEAMMLESGGRPQAHRTNSRPAAAESAARRPSHAQSSSSRSSPAPRWQQQSAPPLMQDARSRLNRMGPDDDTFSIQASANRRKKTTPAPEAPKREPEPDLLFGTDSPKSKPSQPTQSLPQRPATRTPQSQPSRPQARPAPTPSPVPARQVPPISPTVLQKSTTFRLQGTSHFKRGDFASAHASYSSSLNDVPPTHPLTVVLLTNRALTALKTGEPKQAVTDADQALQIIGPGKGHGEKVAVRSENGQDEQRDMKELYGKALSRKAEALEQMEKWKDAGVVWQQCVEAGVGGVTAVKGRQRCQAALAPKPKAAPKPAARPRPKPSAAASLGPQKDSEAVTRLREANQAAAREDDEKFALSEKIDARMSAWRDGKRDNLRALLGSLDQVLWENSGWKKVGMHELVMANKVKIVYMKAIAKTHPDKIPRDASTEIQLIAGGVFSTLNESWDKFKTENGL